MKKLWMESYINITTDNRSVQQEFIIIPGIILYKLYKRYLSSAARSCTGKKGRTRTICNKEAELSALKQTKQELNRNKPKCKKVPSVAQKCLDNVSKELKKLEDKIKKVEKELDNQQAMYSLKPKGA